MLFWCDNKFKENETLLSYLFDFAIIVSVGIFITGFIIVMPLSYDAVKRRNIEEEKTN